MEEVGGSSEYFRVGSAVADTEFSCHNKPETRNLKPYKP